MGKMSVNIKDVAKLANVSISTVSRVINNAPNLKPETKKAVEEAIKKLNYTPNRVAQNLGGKYFNSIGVLSTRSPHQAFVNPYFSIALQAIAQVCENYNHEIMLNFSSNEKQELEKCLSMINGRVVRGFILLSSRLNHALVERLLELNFPFVVIGKVLNEDLAGQVYTVDTDNLGDSKEAVNYLISLNHRTIGCIHAPLKYVVSKERLDGYIEAHKENKLPVNYSLVADGGYTVNDAYEAAKKILSGPVRPTAIFATDDIKGLGVFKALNEAGLRIPDDISLIGHNNYDIAELIQPPLTTIDVPIEQLGSIAAEILFDLINGKQPPKRTILKTKLIIRGSCREI
ncbi:MAG TPA: LacI family transcriptional regulator [Firmicutes bacterium]|nr:LacI family transcriptional regulator [Bacillota bacterium]